MYIVSGCLLGRNCKYNGGNNANEDVIEFSLFQPESTKTGHFMLSNPFSSSQSTDQGFSVLSTAHVKRIVPHYYFAFSEKSNTFAFPTRRSILHVPLSVLDTGYRKSTPARMAESVDALVSNTSGAIRAGSIPAPGTTESCK